LLEDILNHFSVQLASSPLERDRVYRLRHRVYCEEHGYEPLTADRREKDGHDAHSAFCTLTHRETGLTAGCVRLILASSDDLMAMEAHCRDCMYVGDLQSMQESRHEVCEISRLAVDPVFRKRPSESRVAMGGFNARDFCEDERRLFSMLGIATLVTGFAAADLLGRQRNYAMMEAGLNRLLVRSGILVQQVGQFTEYHGRRAPFFITTDVLLEHMRPDMKFLFRQIRSELAVVVHKPAVSAGGFAAVA
jgi:N-acyl amino acid synthase of PEP-CTERM/exosortase system